MAGRINTVLRSDHFVWRMVRGSFSTTADPQMVLSSFSGTYGNINQRRTVVNLTKFFSPIGPPPSVMIAPIMAGCNSGAKLRYRVDLMRGKANSLDRVASVSAIIGTYRVSQLCDGTPITSARYAHTQNCVDYMGTLVERDSGNSNDGKASIGFHVLGADAVVITQLSTIAAGVSYNFEMCGF